MGKTSGKKTNRKLKRTVRRTIGALCLISAITVAAIPVPENYAYNPSSDLDKVPTYSALKSTDTPSRSVTEVASDTNLTMSSLTSGGELNGVTLNSKPKKTYTVTTSAGISYLDWQFEAVSDSSKSNGFIKNFNKAYSSASDTLTVSEFLFADYAHVKVSELSDFYKTENYKKDTTVDTLTVYLQLSEDTVAIPRTIKKLGIVYTLEAYPFDDTDPEFMTLKSDFVSSDEYKYFQINFPSDLDKYIEDYRSYKKGSSSSIPRVEKSLFDSAAYDTVAEQDQYICEQLLSDKTRYNMTVVPVKMYTYTVGSGGNQVQGSENVYIFKIADGVAAATTVDFRNGTLLYTDYDNYLTCDYIRMVGLAENSLEGYSNITNIVLEDNIKYVCDRAFYQSQLIKSVSLPPSAQIGNQAFAESSDLKTVSLGGVKKISPEAFRNTKIEAITIPQTVTEVGDGAFSNCNALKTVTFEGPNSDVVIKAGAFADCVKLESVDMSSAYIKQIGECGFALCDTQFLNKDVMQSFKFSDSIETGANCGKFVLGNRTQLKDVTMSAGMTGKITDLPDNMFAGDTGLSRVYFPDACANVSFDKTMFAAVTNPDFYVEGPAKLNGNFSDPRTSTWVATMNNVSGTPVPIPYKFVDENGVENYEIYQESTPPGNGLILGIDSNGNLVNCTYRTTPSAPADLTIPASVAGKKVIGIASGCFDATKDYINKLTIEDGSGIAEIAANTFEDSSITELYLGDSVTSIGVGAFKNNDKLTKVTIGDNISTIGEHAFESCDNLKTVYIGKGIDQIGAYAFADCVKKDTGGTVTSCLEDIYFASPDSLTEFKLENIGENALSTGGNKLTVHGEIGPEYGPFAWSMQKDNYVDSVSGLRVCYKTNNLKYPDGTEEKTAYTVMLDNTNLMPTIVDIPHFSLLSDTLRGKVNSGAVLTDTEQAMVNSTTIINIPDGIQSIDVKGFITRPATSSVTNKSNGQNVSVYLSSLPYYSQYEDYGLFNGYYGMYADGSDGESAINGLLKNNDYADSSSDHKKYETEKTGNDRITDVRMASVKYLPDKAFESCEKLQLVDLGSAIENVGALPFYQCDSLASIACGNGTYECNNGVLYKNDTDGSREIIEVLGGRGDAVGQSTMNLTNDPYLVSVNKIADGAFSDCDSLKYVYLDGTKNIKTIPKNCFSECDNLKKVDLPTNVSEIDDKAFSNISSDVSVVARNRNLVLATNAFEGSTGSPSYITYEDAPSRIYAKKANVNVEEVLNDVFTVDFYSYDGQELLGSKLVQKGEQAVFPGEDSDIPVREGYTFTGWNKSLKNIQSDMWVLAVYTQNANVTPGVTPGATPGTTPGTKPNTTPGVTPSVSVTPSATKYTLTVVYGSGSGQYPAGTKVIIEAIDAPSGKVFDKWVVTGASATIYSSTSKSTTITTASGDTAVTATYKDASGSSGSGSGSSGSTGTYTRTGTGNTGTSSGYDTNNNGTKVSITKPGISDADKAYASVSGSTDSFVVKITENTDAANAVATALANKYGDMTPIKYFAMDISLYDSTGTNLITDTTGLSVNVTIPIPDALRQYAGNNKVGAVVNGNTLEDLKCKFVTVGGVPCVSFTATHFSPYTVYVDTSNLTYGTPDGSPKTGDPIHPKWFVVLALAATSLFLFLKKDRVAIPKTI